MRIVRKQAVAGLQQAVALTLLASFGCAAKNTDMLHFLREHDHEVSAIEYRVGIPDSIDISAPRILEIDGEGQAIQPDGKINLRLLGEVKVVGMTAKEIAAKLEVLLGRYYSDPKVSVRVAGYASKVYYVRGEVGSPGPRSFTGHDTIIDAIMTSGTTFLSWTSNVTVTRPAHGDVPVRTLHVNLDEMLDSGDWSENILLEPNDVIYVPPTPVAWLGHRVQELLFPIGPAIRAYAAPLDVKYANQEYSQQGTRNARGQRSRIR